MTGHWDASLTLSVEPRGGMSVVGLARHCGPLRVQRAFYPEGPEVCHVYVLHPPGGVVPGDRLTLDVAVASGARGLVTTPAAGKFYKSDGRRSAQSTRLRVGDGASLEWLPQESIYFAGADVELDTVVSLADDAAFVAWDVQCLGRPESGEAFARGRFRQRIEIARQGRPLFVERVAFTGGDDVLRESYGLGRNPAFGTMVVIGSRRDPFEIPDQLTAEAPSGAFVSATRLAEGEVLCCRFIGPSASDGRRWFSRVWALLRPRVLGKHAVHPRIWQS